MRILQKDEDKKEMLCSEGRLGRCWAEVEKSGFSKTIKVNMGKGRAQHGTHLDLCGFSECMLEWRSGPSVLGRSWQCHEYQG